MDDDSGDDRWPKGMGLGLFYYLGYLTTTFINSHVKQVIKIFNYFVETQRKL